MTQIRLTATGQGGKKRTALLSPSSIEELKEGVINVAFGFHSDFDKVIADIVDGNGEVMIQHCDMCEYDNLLFVGYNCDDGIDKCDDGRYYDRYLKKYFDEYDEALKANTREDYDGSIKAVLQYFQKMAASSNYEAVRRLKFNFEWNGYILCYFKNEDGEDDIRAIEKDDDFVDLIESYEPTQTLSISEFEAKFGKSFAELTKRVNGGLNPKRIDTILEMEDTYDIAEDRFKYYVMITK